MAPGRSGHCPPWTGPAFPTVEHWALTVLQAAHRRADQPGPSITKNCATLPVIPFQPACLPPLRQVRKQQDAQVEVCGAHSGNLGTYWPACSVFYLCPKSAVHEKYRRVGSNSSLPYAMDSELTRSISDPGGEEAANPQYFQPDPGDACLTRGQAVFCFVISNIMLFH